MSEPRKRDYLKEAILGESRYSFLEFAELEATEAFRRQRLFGFVTVHIDPFEGEVIVRQTPPEFQKLHQEQLKKRIVERVKTALKEQGYKI